MTATARLDPRWWIRRRHLVLPELRRRGGLVAAAVSRHLGAAYRLADRFGVSVESNAGRLALLRNRYAGRRCFIVGNGPSLKIGDLARLGDDVTIASNKIYLAFRETDWRPTFYTIIDGIVMQNISDEVNSLDLPKIFPAGTEHLFGNDPRSLFCRLGTDWVSPGNFHPGFSDDIVDCVYGGESVTYFNIQIAWFLGCREIYLIGVDHSFTVPQKKVADAGFEFVLEGSGEQNHFVKDYRPVGEKWTMPHLREMEMAFDCARQYAGKHDGAIYNASRKSELEIFERVDFDSLFNASG